MPLTTSTAFAVLFACLAFGAGAFAWHEHGTAAVAQESARQYAAQMLEMRRAAETWKEAAAEQADLVQSAGLAAAATRSATAREVSAVHQAHIPTHCEEAVRWGVEWARGRRALWDAP